VHWRHHPNRQSFNGRDTLEQSESYAREAALLAIIPRQAIVLLNGGTSFDG
jgi:hypothetical protein